MRLRLALLSACAALVSCGGGGDGGDNALPSLSIAATNASQSEGNAGTTSFTFTITRSGNTGAASSASWAVGGATVNAADFVGGALPSGTVDFAAGDTSKLITVPVAGDTLAEADEIFSVSLSNPTGATLGTASASGTILNDDGATPLSAANYVVAAREAISPASFLFDTSGLILGAKVSPANAIMRFSQAQLAQIPGWFSSAPSQFTGVTQTEVEQCPGGGSLTITVVDINGNDQADPGDSVSITASDCLWDGAWVNGVIGFVVDASSGLIGVPPYELMASVTLNNLSVQYGDAVDTASGNFSVHANMISETSGTNSINVAQLSMSSMYGAASLSRTLTNYALSETVDGLSSTVNLTGSVATSAISANTLSVQTVSPVTIIGEADPSSGQMLVGAALGGKIRITALTGGAYIELDADGDGTYETSTTVPWGELI
jgi:hypothetical protein